MYVRLPLRLSNKINFKITTEFMAATCDEFKNIRGVYTNLVCKPMKSEQYSTIPMGKAEWKSQTAIVLQGPVEKKDDFTYETVKLYKKIFCTEEIIISTWDNLEKEDVAKFESIGCHVVLSAYPNSSGRGNVNYQIVSSYAGIRKAKELGCKYVIKSRIDQRITKTNIVDYMRNLIEKFKPENEIQESRLVILQGSTGCMFLPYYIADFLYFGHVNEMLRLFSCDLQEIHFKSRDEINKADLEISKKYKIGEALHYCAPQNYIMENYALKLGRKPDGSVEEYWDFIKCCVLPISVSQLGLVWRKYNNNIFENLWTQDYHFVDNEKLLLTYNWTFENWFNLYSGSMVYKEEYELYRMRDRF